MAPALAAGAGVSERHFYAVLTTPRSSASSGASLHHIPLPDCTYCGVPDCEALFHACLELDFTDPGYGLVHHLVVGAYMLQHDAYSDTVRAAMTAFVHEHLDGPPTPYAMSRIRAATDGAVRVLRGTPRHPLPASPPAAANVPPATVADVDTSSAEGYRQTVRKWAQAVAHVATRDA